MASPSSNAQGVVNNNATMITPSSLPQNRYSQGIVCTSPSLTITPYLTDAWSFNRPIEKFAYQEIYDEDTGAVKYIQKTPRFEKDNYNLNYGISAQINIPLGKSPALCHEATAGNIEAQKLLIKKITKLERSIERDATEAREDFQIRRNEELGKIEKRLKSIILDIAKKGGYDLVLTNNNVTWAKPNSSIDITKKVIKAMK